MSSSTQTNSPVIVAVDEKRPPPPITTSSKKQQAHSLSWSNVTYDIPLSKKARKANEAQLKQDNDIEKGLAQATTVTAAPEDAPPLAPNTRRILSGVSGSVNSGEMVAILGASGAGKTTLLNILSARLSSVGTLFGKVLFHNRPRDPQTWKRTVGFVEQDDVMLGHLTVEETLDYAARMRLPDKLYTTEQKKQRVQDTIQMLRLQTCKDTRIGTANTRGVSGGERKRTSIGTELVSDVSLLLLDEPTSGLDAYAAYSVVEHLRTTTQQRGLSCLMTIHQPSWALLKLMDRVQLLTRGKVYFEGRPGDMLAWFDTVGYHVPEGANPADYYITIAENPDNSAEGEARVQELIQAWATRDVSARPSEEEEEEGGADDDHPAAKVEEEEEEDKSLDAYKVWPTSWLGEVRALTQRNIMQLKRDKDTLIGNIGQTIVVLIVVGFAFFRLKYRQTDVLSRVGVLFFLVINTSFSVLFPVLTPFPIQRAVMKRERSAGTYRASSFFMSKLVVELPSNVLQRIPFFTLFYWMVGLKATASAFFIFMGIGSLQVIVAVCLGLFIGSISRSIELANILAPMITLIFLLFGGNLLPSPPPWFIWLRYISPLTYSYSALAQNEFTGEKFTCAANSLQCYATGEQVLEQYNLQTFDIGQNAGFLVAIAFVLVVLGYIGLRITAHPRFRYN